MGLLISDKIRQIKVRKPNGYIYLYMRLNHTAKVYASYVDCVGEINPVNDYEMLKSIIPKLEEFVAAEIQANRDVEINKKNVALKELSVIFDNIKNENGV
jgi:hypothetical protein